MMQPFYLLFISCICWFITPQFNFLRIFKVYYLNLSILRYVDQDWSGPACLGNIEGFLENPGYVLCILD